MALLNLHKIWRRRKLILLFVLAVALTVSAVLYWPGILGRLPGGGGHSSGPAPTDGHLNGAEATLCGAAPAPAVAQGVTLWGRPIGGCSTAALTAWLDGVAHHLRLEPDAARQDPVTGGNIPQLDGLELDVAATVSRAMQTGEGEPLQPVWRRLPAPVTLADLPPGPLWQANPLRPQVTLLINVAWGDEHIPAMLDLLAEHQAVTTFFLVGRWARQSPALAQAIARGHEIANHGYEAGASGPGHLPPTALAEHITAGADEIFAATGRATAFFSPHKGELTAQMGAVAAHAGHQLVHWSIDTVDWRDPPPEVITARVLDGLHGGALILMHPRAVTVAALPALLAGIADAGYAVVPLSELTSPAPPRALFPQLPSDVPGPPYQREISDP